MLKIAILGKIDQFDKIKPYYSHFFSITFKYTSPPIINHLKTIFMGFIKEYANLTNDLITC